MSLIRQSRLIAGVNFLSELPALLQQALLAVTDKVACGTTFDDAQTLAKYERIEPNINKHADFIDEAMGHEG